MVSIRWQQPTKYLNVSDHCLGLTLKGLKMYWEDQPVFEIPNGGKKFRKVPALEKQGHFPRLILKKKNKFFFQLFLTCFLPVLYVYTP